MFFRSKPAGSYRYLQIVHSVREGKKVRQQVIATLGRLDLLEASGQLERLMRSGLRHCESFAVIDAHAAGEIEPVAIRRIGPGLRAALERKRYSRGTALLTRKVTGTLINSFAKRPYLEQKGTNAGEQCKSESCNSTQSSRFRDPAVRGVTEMGGCGRPSYLSLPKSPARISAVDDEIASGEITARIGCKIHHGGRDLAWFAEAAHRRQF
jgi:hypothetical protein